MKNHWRKGDERSKPVFALLQKVPRARLLVAAVLLLDLACKWSAVPALPAALDLLAQ